VHGADAAGAVVFRRRLRRSGVLQFFATQAPCRVAMEACPSSHYWGESFPTSVMRFDAFLARREISASSTVRTKTRAG
jgi:hypothetical protein